MAVEIKTYRSFALKLTLAISVQAEDVFWAKIIDMILFWKLER